MMNFEKMDQIINRTAKVLLIDVMPFLYGAATRLPFIYFVIHLDQHFELDMLTIGFCVAMSKAHDSSHLRWQQKWFEFLISWKSNWVSWFCNCLCI
mmetsp:Transcript_18006/g.29238  ORF Transcript_18006/g.29238 Transcript_18006/m.29238 type:complete len:96 (+) Transcript_18006:3-290(+)